MQHYRRYVDKIEKVGQCDMRCIMVDAPDALYVTRHHILTHNTHTMLGRTQRILREYTTGRVLLISFTRMASNDLRQKLMRVIPEHEMRRIEVGTFHSVIGKLIRSNAVQVGLQPSVSIIDENSTNTMYRSIIENNPEHLRVAESWFVTPNHKKLVKRDFNKIAGTVSTLVNTAQPQELETGVFSKDTKYRIWKTDTQRINDSNLEEIISMLHKIFIESLKVSRETNTLNYDHILFIGYLMAKNGLLKSYADALVHVIVDEFQDTNKIQYAWIKILAGNTGKVMIVGDDDQSIYGWRGAQVENIQKFLKDFNAETIRLEQNYRSTGNILKSANQLISNNSDRLGKNLWTDGEMGEPVGIYAAFNELDEAKFVASQIQNWVDDGGKLDDCAVLYRSNSQSRVIEEALIRCQIPYRIYGGMRFFERQEIKDALAYLRLINNRQDDAAFERVINTPTRGIGDRTLDVLRNLTRERQITLWQAVQVARQVLQGRCRRRHGRGRRRGRKARALAWSRRR